MNIIDGIIELIEKDLRYIRTLRRFGGGLEAKELYSRTSNHNNTFWRSHMTERTTPRTKRLYIRVAIKSLIKKGNLICMPVRNKYKTFKHGKSHRAVHHYEYRWVDNALDLLAIKLTT